MSSNGEPEPLDLKAFFSSMNVLELHDEEGEKRYPILMELLRPKYKEGKLVRQEGTLRISPHGSLWKIGLECPTEQRQTVIELPSLHDLFKQLESLLKGHKAIWTETYKSRRKALSSLDKPVK